MAVMPSSKITIQQHYNDMLKHNRQAIEWSPWQALCLERAEKSCSKSGDGSVLRPYEYANRLQNQKTL
jgi:hypothetical protein